MHFVRAWTSASVSCAAFRLAKLLWACVLNFLSFVVLIVSHLHVDNAQHNPSNMSSMDTDSEDLDVSLDAAVQAAGETCTAAAVAAVQVLCTHMLLL